jgi:hypothetical protein
MPLKRKDDTNAGRTPKRSKPTFRAPATTVPNDTTISQASSSKNRIITLRTSATGCHGYRTQDVISNPDTIPSPDASASPNFNDPLLAGQDSTDFGSANINDLNDGTDIPAVQAKSRRKQKNTTTLR